MKLEASLLSIDKLSVSQKKRMFEILCTYFNNVGYSCFERDLNEKDWVIVLNESENRQVQGFSTQKLIYTEVEGVPIKALFSGDTIIDKKFWGGYELVKKWFGLVLPLIEDKKQEKFYWFLISMGYKTYRFLPVYFKEFYPRFDKDTPDFEKMVMDRLGAIKYPKEYDKRSGIIHFEERVICLKEEFAEIPVKRLKDPHIRFFLEQNAFYTQGDELVCVAELSYDNFKPIAYKMISNDAKRGVY